MFSPDQIQFIRSIGLNLDFSNLTDDDYMEIETKVGDVYTSEVEDYPDDVTPKILMCESILDHIDEL